MQTNQLQLINPPTNTSNTTFRKVPDDLTFIKNNLDQPRQAQEGIYEKINNIFSKQDSREKEILETRTLIEHYSSQFSDTDILTLNAEAQLLIEAWLDQFEKEIFDGMTLRELLHMT